MSDKDGVVNTLLDKSRLRPIDYPNLTRLGPKGDGGYVVPRDQINDCELLISLGLSDNWAFDKEFLAINSTAKIIGVDHTIGPCWFLRRILVYFWKLILYSSINNHQKRNKYFAKLRNSIGYFSFFKEPHIHLKKRISTRNGKSDISLGQILGSNFTQHAYHDVFLKMDIEGAEYETVPNIVLYQNRIRCIAAEFHDIDKKTSDFNKCMKSLSQHFSVVHIHGNNGAGYDHINDFPSVLEITFINKSLLNREFSFSTSEYPREGLDFPNNPAVPDFGLHFEQTVHD